MSKLFELVTETLKELTTPDVHQPLVEEVVGDEAVAMSLNNFAMAYVRTSGELDVKFLLAVLATGISVGRKYPETVM